MLSVIISLLAGINVFALLYIRHAARKAQVPQPREQWMVFGGLAGGIALAGYTQENLWVSSLALVLASVGVVFSAQAVITAIKARDTTRPPE